MEITNLTESEKAVRLIYKGMRATASAQRDVEYGALLVIWEANPDFRATVRSLAAMLDLEVVNATASQIILRPSRNDSLFRMTLPQARGPQLSRTRGLFALALIAVVAAFFPTGAELASGAPDRSNQMTVEQIEEILSTLCDRIAEKEDGEDPVDEGEEAVETWRVIRAMARSGEGELRAGYNTRAAVVRKAVDTLVEHNMLREDRTGVLVSYIPTERLGMQMRDVLSHEIYQQCIRLLGPAADVKGHDDV